MVGAIVEAPSQSDADEGPAVTRQVWPDNLVEPPLASASVENDAGTSEGSTDEASPQVSVALVPGEAKPPHVAETVRVADQSEDERSEPFVMPETSAQPESPHAAVLGDADNADVRSSDGKPAEADDPFQGAQASNTPQAVEVGGEVTPTEDPLPTTDDDADDEVDKAIRLPRRQKYRPPDRRRPGVPPPRSSGAREAPARAAALPIVVRVLVQRGGTCRLSLLPGRSEALPPEIAVTGDGAPEKLVALQDDWFEDVDLPTNPVDSLSSGIAWQGVGGGIDVDWTLAGRELYVLGPHEELSGYVSTTRLALGVEQVVLCREDLVDRALELIAAAGGRVRTRVGEDGGAPHGWVLLMGINPSQAIVQSEEPSILDVLRPLPDVSIRLSGGIRIGRSSWLHGFPPSIGLLGEWRSAGPVEIDGTTADRSIDGDYQVQNFDSVGDHTVWCAGGSRSYAIADGIDNWELWRAHYGVGGRNSPWTVCGVVVRPVGRVHDFSFAAPSSNRVLVGSRPGQLHSCAVRADLASSFCLAAPSFEAVWAVPKDALHSDKRGSRVLLLRPASPKGSARNRRLRSGKVARAALDGIRRWCYVVLNSHGKGLSIEPSSEAAIQLWHSYGETAKSLIRSIR